LDVSDLQDLRLTAPTASREFIGGRLGLPPQERVRSLISEQLSLRP
jgi:hypothetical protein